MKKLQRYDLEKSYFYGEYNKTMDYGKKNAQLEGVNDCIAQLNDERKQYEQEMSQVIDAEKDNENRKYHFWERWRKIKFISLGIFVIGKFILTPIVNSVCSGNTGTFAILLGGVLTALVFLLSNIALLLFLIAIIAQEISEKSYFKYADNLREQLYDISRNFEDKARKYYLAIDNCYLNSLDSTHREMVLMRREQNEHNRKLQAIAEERNRLERENLEENRKTRYAQERLLQIEQERENRRSRW